MNALILTAVLAGGPDTMTTDDADYAARTVERYATSGTLLFSKGDCLAVKTWTRSPFTHVAAVVEEDGTLYVYDAANGPGVRRQELDDYVTGARPDRLCVVNPARRFTPRCRTTFQTRLTKDLGRRYSVTHYLTGRRSPGVHCAEYVTTALMACELMTAASPQKVSPASLYDGVVDSGVYEEVLDLHVGEPEPDREMGDDWCEQCWIDTKTCVAGWGRGLSRTFLCR